MAFSINNQRDDLVHRAWIRFYADRTQRLKTLHLPELLVRHKPFLLSILGTQRSIEITEGLIQAELRTFETWWDDFKNDLAVSVRLISRPRLASSPYCSDYEEEYGKTVNRLQREFLLEFARDDGSIDWDRLLRFHSGKDPLPAR